jgi:hypothetical protein
MLNLSYIADVSSYPRQACNCGQFVYEMYYYQIPNSYLNNSLFISIKLHAHIYTHMYIYVILPSWRFTASYYTAVLGEIKGWIIFFKNVTIPSEFLFQ